MKVEEAKQITNKALEELAASLESGHSEALTAYLKTMALFSKYSLNNLFLIARQRPDARRVAGYETWRKLGRFVRKGEKGIAIIAPLLRRKPEMESLEPTENQSVVSGFKVAHVFSEEQTDGEPLPEIGRVTGDPGYFLSRLEQFVRENGIELRYSDEIAPARGMAEKGRITLLPEQTPAETFATLVHEVAHSELHFGDRRAETSKRIRETEAESVAYVVCSAIGLETGTAAQESTTLGILAKFIPSDERILLIEDTAEIQIGHENFVRFEARREQNGVPPVGIRDLLKAALRHRPDRILLGEVRGGEAFELLQLLNTGHSGTLSTIHANSARQGLARFASCVLQSGVELPYRAIKTNIGDSLNVVVHVERRPGRRFVSEVLEINSYSPDADLFDYCAVFQKEESKP